jgi:hypothetical protein
LTVHQAREQLAEARLASEDHALRCRREGQAPGDQLPEDLTGLHRLGQ